MRRRPPELVAPQPTPADQSMKITDTMTLVLKDQEGKELRVGGSGFAQKNLAEPSSTSTDATPVSAKKNVEGVLNHIKFDDLKTLEVLGAGSQGKVRKVQHRVTQEYYAVKSIAFPDDKEAARSMVRGELQRIAALKHPNCVSSLEAFFREGKLYIVMEYMDCGTMAKIIKDTESCGFPEPYLAYVAKHTLLGLQHLHASNVVHRDLKPANLLANSRGEVKIADFGVAREFSKEKGDMTYSAVGSTPYMSPERVRGLPYSFSCDIWSCGLSVAECAIGKYPFGPMKNKIFELCEAIASNKISIQWDQSPGRSYSEELKNFVMECMKPPDQRPPAQALLEHPFVKLADGVQPSEIGRWFANPSQRT